MLEFHASGAPGFLPALRDEPMALRVQKKPSRVTVRFASQLETIATREGLVLANPGDAVLTAATGEQWPIGRAVFDLRYQSDATPGVYVSVPRPALALQLHEPFMLQLADGVSRLTGQPGDWLLDYGDGHLGIVGAVIFAATYERIS